MELGMAQDASIWAFQLYNTAFVILNLLEPIAVIAIAILLYRIHRTLSQKKGTPD